MCFNACRLFPLMSAGSVSPVLVFFLKISWMISSQWHHGNYFLIFLSSPLFISHFRGKYFCLCCETTGVRGRIVTIINSEWEHFFTARGSITDAQRVRLTMLKWDQESK